MHALILNRCNDPLELSEAPRPKPTVGQVLVRIAASGLLVNFMGAKWI